MKIAFFANRLGPGGAERTISYLSDYFSEKGHDVYIVIDSDEVFYPLNDLVSLSCLNMPMNLPKNIVKKVILKIVRCFRQRKALKQIEPDIVMAIPTASAELICACKGRGRFSLFASERSNPQFVNLNTMKKNLKVMKDADGVIFQTEKAKSFYPKDIQKKSCVIANAIGNPLVYSIKPPKERDKKIVAIGRLHPVKDYETLIKAFQIVHSIHPEYTLEIFGDGTELEKLKGLSSSLGIGEHVLFRGNQKDALQLAATATCYVLSSIHEGMPNSLMEAMAVGLPCVSTNCPNGPDELIQDGINGLLVPVGDKKEMANAIIRMIEDKQFAYNCSREASKIKETNSISHKAQEFLDYITIR